MTDSPGLAPDATREAPPPRRMIVRSVLRGLVSTIALVTIYYLVPLDRSSTGVTVKMLVVGLSVLVGVTVFQVRTIVVSRYPALRAAEALATSVPLFLLLFAATYTVMSQISAGDFSEPLTRSDALYFTITVLATVGFGDIAAKTEAARLVVTAQMIADLIVLGLGVRVVVGAVGRGRRRRTGATGGAQPGGQAHP